MNVRYDESDDSEDEPPCVIGGEREGALLRSSRDWGTLYLTYFCGLGKAPTSDVYYALKNNAVQKENLYWRDFLVLKLLSEKEEVLEISSAAFPLTYSIVYNQADNPQSYIQQIMYKR